MPLTLRAVSLNDVPLTQPISARFDAAGGTIGRTDNNTMALPDPERHISRQHARITAGPTGFTIRNVGTKNPILVRNQRLLEGESVPLLDRDQVRIGGYLLEVLEEADDGGDATQLVRSPPAIAPVRPAQQPMAPARSSSIGEFNTPLSGSNPFADILGTPAPPALPPRVDPRSAAMAPAPARLPEDFDPFAALSRPAIKPDARPTESKPAGGNPFADLIPDASASSLDDLFGLGRSDAHDPLAAFVSEAPAPSARDAGPSTDPMAMFDRPDARRRTAPPVETSPDQAPELRSAFRPPRPLSMDTDLPRAAPIGDVPDRPPVTAPKPRPRDVVRTEAVSRPASSTSDDVHGLWAAFCEGAQLELDRPAGIDADTLRLIGQIVRSAVQGTTQLMAIRSATRHELHADVTVIRPRNNNPLKFSPDADSALEQLLEPPLRGFLPGPEAMTDAMNDLVGHAIGTMAGTRAALEGVLARFTPRELEAKLVNKSVLDSLLPIHRKAKLWELYLQHYDAIRDEAQEDFHALFGKAFLSAYQQQLDRLHQEKTPSFG